MLESLDKLRESEVFDDLDAAFGEWAGRWGGEPVALAAALVSAEIARGHVCLDLATAGETLRRHGVAVPENWQAALDGSEAIAGPGGRAPLVRDRERLYLHRYWTYETRIADALRELAAPVAGLDPERLKVRLQDLFPEADGVLDRQALAAAIGATRRLTVVSGGPGTGKTTTVIKLIRLVRALLPGVAVALAAPTGKAASRLNDAMAQDWPSGAEAPGAAAQTLHRLLGYNAARQTIRHDAANPLAADLVVVDEASMVDIGLMARLVAALKPDARLVLVGDRDQLASVEAGAVFGDICSAANGFPPDEAERLERLLGAPVPVAAGRVAPISASIALLKRNYRFGDAGIGALARAVIAGDADAAVALLQGEAATGQRLWRPLATERQLDRELDRIVRRHCAPVRNAGSVEEALAQLGRFRLLAAERRGAFGVEGLNARVESVLGVRPQDDWYRGRPVLVTENDYELGLFNGDFGIVWPDADGHDKLWLTASGGGLQSVSLARLPAHETAWALTVHKAQGSEFDRVALVLPPRESAVATRELVYTGITRAREGVEVWATEPAFRAAVERRIRRASGLAARLAGEENRGCA